MRRRANLALAGVTALVAGVMAATPSQAATCTSPIACPTTVTFSITAGSLQITVPTAVTLTGSTTSPYRYAYGQFDPTPTAAPIEVDDDRALAASATWTATVTIPTPFTNGTDTIPASNVYYHSGNATLGPVSNGTGSIAAGQPDPFTTPTSTLPNTPTPTDWAQMSSPVIAFNRTGGAAATGSSSVGWNPYLVVYVNGFPASPPVYTGTINHAVT